MAMGLTTGSTAPFLMVPAVAGGFVGGSTATAGNLWGYRTTDGVSSVVGSSYFTDGWQRGMRKYDIIAIIDTNTPRLTWGFVSAVTTGATPQSGGGATVLLFSTT